MIYHLSDDQSITVDSSSASFINTNAKLKANSGSEDDMCSSPELDVVSFTPGPQSSSSSAAADDPNNQKRYFCQRCLNHKLEFPRKGHKPFCRYAMCHCDDCMMVEYRRRLNNQLSQRRLDPDQVAAGKRADAGKKIRDPKCARCSAHGEKQALRGHKKALCPYLKCGCHLCNLVENRRTLMAKQIKLRRDQQKARKAQHTQGGEVADFKTSPIKPTKQSARNPTFAPVFARPTAVRDRKRSYDSIMNSAPSPTAGQSSGGSAPPPALVAPQAADLTAEMPPMLLPPSLLYQQLCLRSQQQQSEQLINLTSHHLPTTTGSSPTQSFNLMGFSPPLTAAGQQSHNAQLTNSLLLVNALTACASPPQPSVSVGFVPAAASLPTSQPQTQSSIISAPCATENNSTLVLQALNLFNITSALTLSKDGSQSAESNSAALSKALLERLAVAVLSNSSAVSPPVIPANFATPAISCNADEVAKNIQINIPAVSYMITTGRDTTPPSPSEPANSLSSPLANFLLQYSAALS